MMTFELLRQVAKHLTGRAVMVRWQEPIWSNASGACYKSLSGDCIIDVNPGATDPLYTFLHECAHIRADFDDMAPSDYWQCEPGSQVLPQPQRVELRALPRENLADMIARIWLDYAKQNAWKYYSAQNRLEAELRALLDYPKKEI